MADYWGVVQLVGHLTVNEDGVGSSPTAPASSRKPACFPNAVDLRKEFLRSLIGLLMNRSAGQQAWRVVLDRYKPRSFLQILR